MRGDSLRHTSGHRGNRVASSRGMAFSRSPVLSRALPQWRSNFVLFVLFAAFAVLIGRALWLQGMTTDFLQKQGASRYARTIELPAIRGRILDRNGQVLASSMPVKAIWAIPEDVLQAPADKLARLATLLDMSDAELRKKLDSDRSFVYLKRQVEDDVSSKIVALDIPGISTRKEYKRFYPQGEVTAHVVGFTNVEDVGQDGMELSQQKTLVGVTGSRRVIKDRLGHIVEDIEAIKEPHDGRDLTLSIDSKVQYIAYTRLKAMVEKTGAKAGAIIVLDAHTGEVLAMANTPSYNPNDRSHLTGAQLRNRVMTDTFEPGSTLKPFTISLSLDTNRITPSTTFQTAPGKMTIGTATIGDSHAHGLLTVAQIIQKSSNIGTSKIALQMPPEEMWDMFTTVGLGQAPRFGFPGAVAGRVRPWKAWRPIEQATMSYGQGISVSLVQLARAYLIFARNGDIIPLSFTRVTEPPVGQRVISEKTALEMRAMMETVTQPGGTAPRAQVAGYRVAGKTGTAYKIENGRYNPRHVVASFSGLAPASDPRIVVSVMLDEPTNAYRFGGASAAPVFSDVTAATLRALNVPPDSEVTDIVVPKNSEEVM